MLINNVEAMRSSRGHHLEENSIWYQHKVLVLKIVEMQGGE